MPLGSSLPAGWECPELDGRGNGPYGLLHLLSLGRVRRFEAGLARPAEAQEEALERVLDAARGTEIGRRLSLGQVRTLAEYRAAVPIRSFGDHAADLAREARGEGGVLVRHPVRRLLKTSGTTAEPKLLPVTDPWEAEVADGQALWTRAMVKEHEAIAHGTALNVVGPFHEAFGQSGLSIGSNTGRMARHQPFYVRGRQALPDDVSEIRDPELRTYVTLRVGLASPVVSLTTANPTTILALCRAYLRWREELAADLRDQTLRRGPAERLDPELAHDWARRGQRVRPLGDRLGQCWDLAAVNCWKGGAARFFVDRLPEALGVHVPVCEVGITASEGYFAAPLHSSWSGGVAHVGGHLLELVPEGSDVALSVDELEIGRTYRLVISTTAGLYRYDLDDWVEVVGRYGNLPVLSFVGKGRDVLSSTGEKVTARQLGLAASEALATETVGFGVGVVLEEQPYLVVAVEGPVDAVRAAAFEAALQRINGEYASKRSTDRMAPLRLVAVPAGTFARHRLGRLRAGVAESQVKDPVVVHGGDLSRLLGGWWEGGAA